jgi:hypothetical protein
LQGLNAGWYLIDFARGRPTNPARIPVGASAYGMHTSYQPIDFLGLPIFARDQDKAFSETLNS